MLNLILLKRLVNDGCLHPLSVNFFYKQNNHLSGCWREAFLITLSKRRFDQIFVLVTEFLVSKPRHAATRAHLFLLHYIVVSNLEADVLSRQSQFYCVSWVAHLVLISFKQVCGLWKIGYIFNSWLLLSLVILLDFEQARNLQEGRRFSSQTTAITPTTS